MALCAYNAFINYIGLKTKYTFIYESDYSNQFHYINLLSLKLIFFSHLPLILTQVGIYLIPSVLSIISFLVAINDVLYFHNLLALIKEYNKDKIFWLFCILVITVMVLLMLLLINVLVILLSNSLF